MFRVNFSPYRQFQARLWSGFERNAGLEHQRQSFRVAVHEPSLCAHGVRDKACEGIARPLRPQLPPLLRG